MTIETLTFLRNLLGQQNLNAGADDFEQVVRLVVNAKRELEEAIAEQTSATENHKK